MDEIPTTPKIASIRPHRSLFFLSISLKFSPLSQSLSFSIHSVSPSLSRFLSAQSRTETRGRR
ncbi:hypothetical protein CsatB_026010 [Cannabis sativa]